MPSGLTPSTLNNGFNFRPMIANGTIREEQATVAASTTIQRGDILALSSGQVVQAIALPGSNNSVSLSGGNLAIYGVALGSIATNASGVDTSSGFNITTIPVAVFDNNLEVMYRLYNATASNTNPPDVTIGTAYQFGRWRGASASEWFYVISTTTTNGEMRYVEAYGLNLQQDTDTYTPMWVKPINSVMQGTL